VTNEVPDRCIPTTPTGLSAMYTAKTTIFADGSVNLADFR
jgi:hypothetical protein